MNETSVEKLNAALMQLIEAYEKLQAKNDGLEENIKELNGKIDSLETQKSDLIEERNDLDAKNKDLEYRLNDFNSSSEQQETKMDGMLNKIQSLLSTKESVTTHQNTTNHKEKEDTSIEAKKETEDISGEKILASLRNDNETSGNKDDLDVLDLKLNDDEEEEATSAPSNNSSEYDKTKLDLGRMESLLNGLNK